MATENNASSDPVLTYTISYNANGGINAPEPQTKTAGTPLKLSTVEPTRTGYTFLGWTESAYASIPSYKAGDSFEADYNATLYAVWKRKIYIISYDSNGGINTPDSQEKVYDVNISLSLSKPMRTGYRFVNWNTSMDGTGDSYEPGGVITADAPLQLYAQWERIQCTIIYHANGGQGEPETIVEGYGSHINISTTKPTKDECYFLGWSPNEDATSPTYSGGEEYIVDSDLNLYAVWEKNVSVLKTTEHIFLDLYNQTITSVTTKQLDSDSRFIHITCTDHGKKVRLSNDSMSAYVRYKKNDGTFIFNDAQITDDGSVVVTLTQQMTSTVGRNSVDLLITSLTGISAGDLVDMKTIYDMGATIISTMQFYLNVVRSSIDEDKVTSTSEYSALVNAMTRLARTEKNMQELDERLNTNEEARQAAEIKREDDTTGEAYRIANEIRRQDDKTGEAYRITNEAARVAAEQKRETDVQKTISDCNVRIDRTIATCKEEINNTIEDCETKIDNTITECTTKIDNTISECNSKIDTTISESTTKIDTAVTKAETATENANTATSNAEAATEKCATATSAANQTVEEFKTIKDQSGLVMQDEKGSANGVATLGEDGKVPSDQLDLSHFVANNVTTEEEGLILDARQGKVLDDSIQELQELLRTTIDGLQKIYFNDTVDDSIGKDGDILMVPIE